MKCPKCGVDDDKVLDSRGARDGAAIRRTFTSAPPRIELKGRGW